MSVIVFIGRIGKHGKNRYHIEIPDEVLDNPEVREKIEKLYEKGAFIVVEIKPLHGAHRMYKHQ